MVPRGGIEPPTRGFSTRINTYPGRFGTPARRSQRVVGAFWHCFAYQPTRGSRGQII